MSYNINNMKCLDVFLNSLSSEKYESLKPDLKDTNSSVRDLLSADLYFQYLDKLLKKADVNNDIYALDNLAQKYHWENNIADILKENYFETLVVTDISKKILWVNDGFSKMTGYSKKFALNKKPSFLQGRNTLEKTRNTIRKRLDHQKPFKEIIVNYKKDNSSYKCELYIFPLYDTNKKVTHYLALEKQVA